MFKTSFVYNFHPANTLYRSLWIGEMTAPSDSVILKYKFGYSILLVVARIQQILQRCTQSSSKERGQFIIYCPPKKVKANHYYGATT